MRTILVTGCAGFIGTNLIKELLKDKNNYIIGLDNLFTGRIENLKLFAEYDNFEFIRHDVINPIDLIVEDIFHLASPASPVYYQKDAIKTLETNILGTKYMLNICKNHQSRILFTSTSEVYGDPLIHPQPETYWGNVNPIGPRSCYDEAKRVSETLVMEYRKTYKINSKIARVFNTYGPYMTYNDGRVISNFIVNAILNKDIHIYGSGEQTRSFCYIDDMIEGLKKLMNTSFEISGPINLGNDEEITIKELAQMIVKLTNSNSQIIHISPKEDDPLKRKPDIKIAKNILNWQAKISLETGLKRTIDYFRRILL